MTARKLGYVVIKAKMQTTILQMFKRKERDEETQNVLKIRKTTPTDDTGDDAYLAQRMDMNLAMMNIIS